MTMQNGVRPDAAGGTIDGANVRPISRSATTDLAWLDRTRARLFATTYDRRVEAGDKVTEGTPLAAHYVRLASDRERRDMAQALGFLLKDAGITTRSGGTTMRVPIRTEVVRQCVDVIDDVLARLNGPLPVRARGMARLRLLLGDGRGPVYRPDAGSFAAAMRGVLAAL